jgi:dephospho-CoA kinase
MADTATTNAHIIGLTGSFGSGCTYVATNLLADLGYRRISLSDLLRKEYASKTGQSNGVPRGELQAFGDELRQTRGASRLAELAHATIVQAGQPDPPAKWVIDSIRNPAEVHYLRRC